jgi:hypothetical protein
VVALSATDYTHLTKEMVGLDLVSGIIYDGIILKAALKADVKELYTLNGKDFLRLCPPSSIKIIEV